MDWVRLLGEGLGRLLRPVQIPPEAPARPAMDGDTRRRLLVFEAMRWRGAHEVGGDNRGWAVEQFQQAVDGKASDEAWCAAFVWYCIGMVDDVAAFLHDSHRSPLYPSELVMDVWRRSPEGMRRKLPRVGDVMVWQHYDGDKPTGRGHIGIVTNYPGDRIVHTIEGNTGPGPGVVREGDGVYEKLRNLTGSGSMRVEGFLGVWP